MHVNRCNRLWFSHICVLYNSCLHRMLVFVWWMYYASMCSVSLYILCWWLLKEVIKTWTSKIGLIVSCSLLFSSWTLMEFLYFILEGKISCVLTWILCLLEFAVCFLNIETGQTWFSGSWTRSLKFSFHLGFALLSLVDVRSWVLCRTKNLQSVTVSCTHSHHSIKDLQ